jgi:PAS domain S-box-containing protein
LRTANTPLSLQSILDNLPTPVFVKDTAGIYRACNRAFQEYVGLPRDRIVGRGVFDVAPPELAEKYKAMDDALFARPGSQTYDGSVRYADDTRHDVHFIKHTFTDTQGRVAGIVGAMLDITEVRRSEQRYRDLYEQMINGYALHEIICDAQGVPCDYRFLQVNTAFEKLTGLKREDIIGRTVKEVLPGTEDSWIKTYGQVALNGAPVFFESYSAALATGMKSTPSARSGANSPRFSATPPSASARSTRSAKARPCCAPSRTICLTGVQSGPGHAL